MSEMVYGKMRPVRGIDLPKRDGRHQPTRNKEVAIREKMKVLRGFGIVNSKNEEAMEAKLRRAIDENPSKDFDRVLDCFARKLISKKLGD